MQHENLFTPTLGLDDSEESSGISAEIDGEFRSITGVIHIAEARGEDIRAQLMRNLQGLVKESRRLRDLTRELALAEGIELVTES